MKTRKEGGNLFTKCPALFTCNLTAVTDVEKEGLK